jgi:hypothetical protein
MFGNQIGIADANRIGWRPVGLHVVRRRKIIEIAAGDLDELTGNGAWKIGQLQNQPEMLAAEGLIAIDDRLELRPDRCSHECHGHGKWLLKKDFRRGGSYPPPEVRHGKEAVSHPV